MKSYGISFFITPGAEVLVLHVGYGQINCLIFLGHLSNSGDL